MSSLLVIVVDADVSLQAENFRKMILTISNDIRVVLIKIADRLDNMRTLGYLKPDKQARIASETLYLYAPLAHRLGLYSIKTELEDLSLKHTESDIYFSISEKLKETNTVQFVVKCPFRVTQDLHKIIDSFISNTVLKKLLYGILQLSIPIFSVWRIYKLRTLFLEYNLSTIFSHNGGYPGGELNRLATIAAKLAGIKNNYMIIHNFPAPRHRITALFSKIEDWLITPHH